MEDNLPTERSSLLARNESTDNQDQGADKQDKNALVNAIAVLPIALLSALAMAATAATTIYAYASLTCEDPTHCKETEKNTYAGIVAIAMTIAHLCALLALGTMAKISKRNRKVGLGAWIVCRSMSIVVLAFGVHIGSIAVAVCGQVFDGLASDNILHFSLNAIYVQVPSQKTVSRLIGASLALYMIGISISPSISSLLPNFQASFALAVALFAAALIYLLVCVPGVSPKEPGVRTADVPADNVIPPETGRSFSALAFLKTTISPLSLFVTRPLTLVPGIALFLYNAIQSYTFPAIMVHTSLDFGFSGRENGFLISIAHGTASVYLMVTLFIGPALLECFGNTKRKHILQSHNSQQKLDAPLAVSSMLIQAIALSLLAVATEAWQIYSTVALCALGLSTPSFVKSYFVTLFDKAEGPQAVAALAMMETFGALTAPIVLGGIQSISPGRGIFFFASGCVVLAALVFAAGATILEFRRPR